MKLNVLNLSLCRVPAFGIYDELPQVWPALKAKIKAASPSFYMQVAEIEADQLDTLSEKVRFTIWKYFNRAKYRATPFADFASYSIIPLHVKPTSIKIESDMKHHLFTEWRAKDVEDATAKTTLKNCNQFFSNTSAYYTHTEIRYLRILEGSFELNAVNIFPELKSLLQFCNVKRDKIQLYKFMNSTYQLNHPQCKNLITQLIDLQLLHTNRTANITGEDYFKRLNLSSDDHKGHYELAERRLIEGGINQRKSEEIGEALNFLAQQLPKSKNRDLQSFKTNFLKKFDHQEVPLAIVMDPELGIGYGNLAQYAQPEELIEKLEVAVSKKKSSLSMQYTELHQFLINEMLNSQSVALEKFQSTVSNPSRLSNTLGVICHFYNNQAVITHAGGCTSNSLLGRFTLANEVLEDHCRKIATFEQHANPNVLFFDIAYQAEVHIDNVNRRKNCYPYELPILSWSCQSEPLVVADIYVSIKGDEIVLFSKKLGKRLIPRLASAYNYTRSDLPLYRFLCDLQHQGIQSNLTFDFQNFLPGLNFYPRVSYKAVILSPAKWLIPASIYQQKHKTSTENLTILSSWLSQNNINFLVKTGISDQTLCFNPLVLTDCKALFQYCTQQENRPIYLTEALIDEEGTVLDEKKKKYNAEFILNFSHQEQIYQPVNTKNLSFNDKRVLRKHYLPGSEWLYFEIFIHPSKSNSLLCNEIYPLIKTYKSEIIRWFFIRYDEHGKHIRLRLHIKNLEKRLVIIEHFNALFNSLMENGVIRDVVLKTYRPEFARYGANRMTSIEQFFCLDSKCVISFLSKTTDKNKIYHFALLFLNKMTNLCFEHLTDRLHFVRSMTDSFSNEFNLTKEEFKKINQSFSLLQQNKPLALNKEEFHFKPLENKMQLILRQCNELEKSKLLADVIHMHLNRLFNDRQRLQEAICYQFYYKQLLTIRAHLNVQEEHLASA